MITRPRPCGRRPIELADGLWALRGRPRWAINVYIADGHLVDAATRWASRRILRQIGAHQLAGHVLTHAHPDHQGASRDICTRLALPLLCGHADADAMAQGRIPETQPRHPLNTLLFALWLGPAHPVSRELHEGDRVGRYTVLEVAGHSPGHIALWEEHRRILLLGDVLNGVDVRTGRVGLQEPQAIFTSDAEANRRAIRRVAALRPELVCFGHGPPLRDPDALWRFAEQLPR